MDIFEPASPNDKIVLEDRIRQIEEIVKKRKLVQLKSDNSNTQYYYDPINIYIWKTEQTTSTFVFLHKPATEEYIRIAELNKIKIPRLSDIQVPILD